MPPERKVKVSEKEKLAWIQLGGDDLTEVLRCGAVALLDAKWLVQLAAQHGVLPPRQCIPPCGFISEDELKVPIVVHGLAFDALSELTGLRIACISYPWLTPAHPDPQGRSLQLVAKALRALLDDWDGRCGVFWEFGSLHQHQGNPSGKRLPTEETLFKKALGSLGAIYAHNHTTVFMLTAFPDGYPEGYDVPDGANINEYRERGWCFCESSWAALAKPRHRTLDLGKYTGSRKERHTSEWNELVRECTTAGGRRPPLVPEKFALQLETKGFTNGKEDRPLVNRIYRLGFEQQFRSAVTLNYSLLRWSDDETATAVDVIAIGAVPNLTSLDLSFNAISDAGCEALSNAIKSCGVPKLETLLLSHNRIGDRGCCAFGTALASGAVQELKVVLLDHNQIGDTGCAALASALKSDTSLQLTNVDLSRNAIGDRGFEGLAAALIEDNVARELWRLKFKQGFDGGFGITQRQLGHGEGALSDVCRRRGIQEF